MVAVIQALIAQRVSEIACDLWMWLERYSGSEIPQAVLTGKPIGRKREVFIYRLLKTKLAPRAIDILRYDTACKVITAKGHSCARFECLADLSIGVVTDAICTI